MRLTLAGEVFVSDQVFTFISDAHMHRQLLGKAIVEHADNDGAIRLVPPWSGYAVMHGGLAVREKLDKLTMAWDEWGGGA